MKIIKKIPIPMSAVMLASLALGNLLLSYGDIYRNIMGVIGLTLFLLLLFKFTFYVKETKKELDNPIIASVIPTFSMGIMLLATYFKPYHNEFASFFWTIGLMLHVFFIISFSKKYINNFDLKNVFPTWFIVYVGIVVSSVTAPAFSNQFIGKIAFIFGFIYYFILLYFCIKRMNKYEIVKPQARPTIAIMAAPASLCLAGYMNSFDNKNILLVYLLLLLSQITYFIVLSKIPKIIKDGFYPSFGALTFPLVITALSLKLTTGYLLSIDKKISILKYLVKFEELISVAIVLYVLIKYIKFLLKK